MTMMDDTIGSLTQQLDEQFESRSGSSVIRIILRSIIVLVMWLVWSKRSVCSLVCGTGWWWWYSSNIPPLMNSMTMDRHWKATAKCVCRCRIWLVSWSVSSICCRSYGVSCRLMVGYNCSCCERFFFESHVLSSIEKMRCGGIASGIRMTTVHISNNSLVTLDDTKEVPLFLSQQGNGEKMTMTSFPINSSLDSTGIFFTQQPHSTPSLLVPVYITYLISSP